jgi:ATP-grasp domain
MNNHKLDSLKSANSKVLLTDTNRWALAARLAIGLADSGCEVSAICPFPSHALMKTSVVRRIFRYSALRPLDSLRAAIEAVDPDIIVPACDRSVTHLHELYALAKSREAGMPKMAALIERSLGAPESHSIVSSRYELIEAARKEGIRVPRSARICNAVDLEAWHAKEPFPWVSKADGTWGGSGVRIIKQSEEGLSALTQFEQMDRLTRAIKRMIVNRDPFLFRPWWSRSKRSITVQSYIQGRPANCTAFAWKGRVRAMIGVEVIRSQGLTGPASIVRLVENEDMRFAAERLAARLGLSGFFGLDFMIEEASGSAYLIEMNPRLAPPCHLRLDKGRDLAGALWSQLTGRPLVEPPNLMQSDLIAYFPQAAHNEHQMPAACFLDVPESEPELIKELLNPFPDRTLMFRLVQWISRIRTHEEDFEPAAIHGAEASNGSRQDPQGDGKNSAMDRPAESARVPLV